MKVVGKNIEGICSRCGSRLVLVIEKTLGDGARKINYIYRCTGCGAKRPAGSIKISKVNGTVKVTVYRASENKN